MVYLIALPFFALIAGILAFRLMRGLRRSSELSSQRPSLALTPAIRKPSDIYHDPVWLPLCNTIAQAAEKRLLRQLDHDERSLIWQTRSALILEVLLKEIETAGSSDEVAAMLRSIPPGMDRPDPTNWRE